MPLTIIGNLCPRHKNTLEIFVLQDISEIKPEYFKVHGPSERKDCLPKDILAIDDAVKLFLKNDTRFGDDYSIIISDVAASYKILAPRFSFNAIIGLVKFLNAAVHIIKSKVSVSKGIFEASPCLNLTFTPAWYALSCAISTNVLLISNPVTL